MATTAALNPDSASCARGQPPDTLVGSRAGLSDEEARGEARDRDRSSREGERRAGRALPRGCSRAVAQPRARPRRRARTRRDLPRDDGDDGPQREGPLRGRRLRRVRRSHDPGALRGRADGRGRRRQDLRRPPRTRGPDPHGRIRRARGHARGRQGLTMPKGINAGDTAWMFVATALVMMMTPALGIFYAGLVRSKNSLNTFMMCMAAFAVVGVVWALLGYSLAFGGSGALIGGFDHVFLHDVGFGPQAGLAIPQLLYFAYEATFAILTSALVAGAVVERMRFQTFLVFMAVWSLLVYAVLAHWVWGGGWLADGGTLDFAGGVPVEMASGFSAFAAAIAVGARRDFGRQALLPHNALYVVLGAGLLWFGWFGFNGGSGYTIGSIGVLAFVNTLLAPCCTLAVWFVLDLVRGRKITAIGAATAVIVGCVGITPAAGYISPTWAMALGAIAAVPSWWFINWRTRTRLDETLDVLAAHGLAGL